MGVGLADETFSSVEQGASVSIVSPSSYKQTPRYSILPALSLDGILHLAVEDHPYTAREFNSFIDGLLDVMNPFPGPNSVIVMDNASIHKSWELRDMIERRCARFMYA